MRRLYLQIYVTIVAILLIFAIAAGVMWRAAIENSRIDEVFEEVSEFVGERLPRPDAPRGLQQRAIDGLHQRLRVDLALYAPDGRLVVFAGKPMPPVLADRAQPGWQPGPGGPLWLLRLNDGRWLAARIPRGPIKPGAWLLFSLLAIGVAVAIGAYPLARRLTRRLERLRSGVEQLGQGDLAARVKIEGKDEIAALAQSFNRSAGRVEELVNAQKMLLANASHELRTPLARINIALSLLGPNVDAAKADLIKSDIAELDQLIDEILLASRLDAAKAAERPEQVDLLALAAEEAARDNIGVEGEPAPLRGERALLRRLIRNLIVNAQRHGKDTSPEIRVRRVSADRVALEVRDHGPGVPEAERQKIFEPFYRVAGTAESGRGSGLGLALVRQIARRHGGEAECREAPGGGSLFVVTLPQSPGP
jgi:signal transduction histidine kinase